ncbi:MAG: DUF748 domain-containing protein [Candidatus Binatia bacterium]
MAKRNWRAVLRRWRWLLVAVAAVILIRAALPEALRRAAESQASAALHAQVEVGDVDLTLWRLGVALEDVAVRAAAQPDAGPPGSRTTTSTSAPDAETPPAAGESAARTATPTATSITGTPPATPDAGGTPPAAGDVAAEAPVIIGFKRLAAELRLVPLFDKTIQLREVALDGPRVALDRLASGDLNILALIPRQPVAVEAGATPSVEAPAGGGWKFGLDKFLLTNGRVRFRDLAVQGSEPVEVGIDRVSVEEIALTPEVYGEPARVQLTLGVDEGAIEVDARLRIVGGGVAMTTDVHAQRLPLRHARLYVPEVGWSSLIGELDLDLTYALEPDREHHIGGSLGLRNVAVKVPDQPDVVAGWEALNVVLDRVDLLARRAAVKQVALDGARLSVRSKGGQRIMALAQRVRDQGRPSAPAVPATGATPTAAAAPADAAAPVPWQWSVDEVKVGDSMLRVVSDQPPMDIAVKLSAAQLKSAPDAIGHIALALGVGDGSLAFEGDVRIGRPALRGALKIQDLALPPMVATGTTLPSETLPSGVLRADLGIEAGLARDVAGAAATDRLRIAGTLGIADLRAAPPGSGLAVQLEDMALRIDRLEVPGITPSGQPAAPGSSIDLDALLELRGAEVVRSPGATAGAGTPARATGALRARADVLALDIFSLSVPAALAGFGAGEAGSIGGAMELKSTALRVALDDGKAFAVAAKNVRVPVTRVSIPMGAASAPMQMQLGDVHIDSPAIRLTRAKAGMVLPGSGAPAGATQAASRPAQPAASAPSAAPGYQMQMAALRVARGRLDFTDQSVQPTFNNRFAPIEIDARNIQLPGPKIGSLDLQIGNAERGTLTVRGQLAPESSNVALTMDRFSLTPFNPYAAAYSPYSIADGALSISSKATASGGKFDISNDITLHHFDLAGAEGDTLFEQQFGIPLTMALALLRDVQGDIVLGIPVSVDREGSAAVDVLAVVRSALRQALIGAISSPLKMVGAVVGGGSGGSHAALAPSPIAFRLGRAELTSAGEESVGQLAAFLGGRPGVAVELATAPTADDVRWLREQALLAEWGGEGLFKRSMGFVLERGVRDRVGAYLRRRADEESAELSEEDAAALDGWLAERPTPGTDELRALAQGRLAAVQSALRDQGVDAARIALAEPAGTPAGGAPLVSIKLYAAGRGAPGTAPPGSEPANP